MRSLALLAALLVAPVALAEVPFVDLAPGPPLETHGQAFRSADASGRHWFFKPASRGANGTAAELLLPRLFQRAGVPAAEVRLVRLPGREGLFLQSEVMDQRFFQGRARPRAPDLVGKRWLKTLDARQVRSAQLVDTLAANADRHAGNLFVNKGSRWVPRAKLPATIGMLDHDLALLTPEEAPKGAMKSHSGRFYGFQKGLGKPVTPVELLGQLGPLGSPAHHMAANDAYRQVIRQDMASPEGLRPYAVQAEELRRALPDDVLAEEVRRLPPEAFPEGEAAARKATILDRLKGRRDALPGYMDRVARGGGEAPGFEDLNLRAAAPDSGGTRAVAGAATSRAAGRGARRLQAGTRQARPPLRQARPPQRQARPPQRRTVRSGPGVRTARRLPRRVAARPKLRVRFRPKLRLRGIR